MIRRGEDEVGGSEYAVAARICPSRSELFLFLAFAFSWDEVVCKMTLSFGLICK